MVGFDQPDISFLRIERRSISRIGRRRGRSGDAAIVRRHVFVVVEGGRKVLFMRVVLKGALIGRRGTSVVATGAAVSRRRAADRLPALSFPQLVRGRTLITLIISRRIGDVGDVEGRQRRTESRRNRVLLNAFSSASTSGSRESFEAAAVTRSASLLFVGKRRRDRA